MKPLKTEIQDAETLRQVGAASVQIVHDLKNQLNGLKLYATFLKKRLEKSDRPSDEIETVGKIITGLERAASDMTVLVRLGRPLDVRQRPSTDLAALVAIATGDGRLEITGRGYEGDFDPALLEEALKTISAIAADGDSATTPSQPPETRLIREEESGHSHAVIEWRVFGKHGLPEDLFGGFAGCKGLRMALAARIIRAHRGEVGQTANTLTVRLPLK
jgi:hypothetical protein